MDNKGIIIYSRDNFKGKNASKTESERTDHFDILGKLVRTAREERNLTVEQLGELVNLPTDQIVKLEHAAKSVPIENILKVFNALQAEISFNVKLEDNFIKLA